MIRPSLRKIISDLINNPMRSLLVVASIFVGLFAIGVIATTYIVVSQDMVVSYQAIHPANIVINTGLYEKDLLETLRQVEGVDKVEGERSADLQVKTISGDWKPISLRAIPDINTKSINQLILLEGTWPPGENQVVLDQHRLSETGARIGDDITVELPSGKTRALKLVGVVQDQTIGFGNAGGFFNANQQGYILPETMEVLEQSLPYHLSKVYVTVKGDTGDEALVDAAKERVREKIDNSGVDLYNVETRDSRAHPNRDLARAVLNVLLMLGLMVVLLSGFLITNTLQALLNQQTAQVGIMKTVGATKAQIIAIYMALILVFGLAAFALAAPLSNRVALRLVSFLAGQLNLVVQPRQVVPQTIWLQIALAILVPEGAAFIPVWQGAQRSVVQALNGTEQNDVSSQGWIVTLIMHLKRISRPMRIALRNVFRKKGRLALTLITLTLGGAIFIATFNVRISLQNYIDQIGNYFLADVNFTTRRPYRVEEMRAILEDVPGVGYVEGWSGARSEVLLDNGMTGDRVQLMAPPANSALVSPVMIEGRWIEAEDQNAIVLNDQFHTNFPDLKVGDTIRLRVNDSDTDWVIVGFFQLSGKLGGYIAYANYEYVSDLVHQHAQANMFRVVASQPADVEAQDRLARLVEVKLKENNISTTEVSTGAHISNNASQGFTILTAFLMFMALLIALVGSIGLAGTMSMNVMERTREIGIMRSIGATNKVLMQMVMMEGVVIGVLSWIAGAALSFPASKTLADSVNMAIFGASSKLGYSANGFVIWLALVVALSVSASFVPARSASRLTIREVLAYE